jgi:hypothetical protein
VARRAPRQLGLREQGAATQLPKLRFGERLNSREVSGLTVFSSVESRAFAAFVESPGHGRPRAHRPTATQVEERQSVCDPVRTDSA